MATIRDLCASVDAVRVAALPQRIYESVERCVQLELTNRMPEIQRLFDFQPPPVVIRLCRDLFKFVETLAKEMADSTVELKLHSLLIAWSQSSPIPEADLTILECLGRLDGLVDAVKLADFAEHLSVPSAFLLKESDNVHLTRHFIKIIHSGSGMLEANESFICWKMVFRMLRLELVRHRMSGAIERGVFDGMNETLVRVIDGNLSRDSFKRPGESMTDIVMEGP